jgi:hypothetical protein
MIHAGKHIQNLMTLKFDFKESANLEARECVSDTAIAPHRVTLPKKL